MSATWTVIDLADRPYDGDRLLAELEAVIDCSPMIGERRLNTLLSTRELRAILDGLSGETLQERWGAFEWRVWPGWVVGVGRAPEHRWSFGVANLVIAQAVRPSWPFLECTYTRKWVKHLPTEVPLAIAAARLRPAFEAVAWSSMGLQDKALKNGLRIMMVAGYRELEQITDEDLR